MKKAVQVLKKVLWVSMVLAICAGFVFVLVSAISKQQELRCKGVEVRVDYDSGNSFITQKEIDERIVFLSGRSVVGKRLQQIDLRTIERDLRRNPFVADAQLHFTQEQKLVVRIVQKNALLRVINKDGVSYYIATDNSRMPLSNNFTAQVPLVLGNAKSGTNIQRDSTMQNALFHLGSYIAADTLLQALVDQIWVNDSDELELYTHFKGHSVLLGDDTNLDDKFYRLKVFYREAMIRTGWQKYQRINLKFSGQVVAEKQIATTNISI